MEGRERGKVARRDGSLARTHREISRQLCPEGGLHGEILASDRHAGVGEQIASKRDPVVERLETPGVTLPRRFLQIRQNLQREMVVAHYEVVAAECIECFLQLCRL